VLMIGRVVSMPFAKKICASSLSDFNVPFSFSSSAKGRFFEPVMCPERTPFLGSGTSPLNLYALLASTICQLDAFLEM